MSLMATFHPSMVNLIISLTLVLYAFGQHETEFIYNGFQGSINKLHVDGIAAILPNGLLQMTNYSKRNTSHAFYPHPVNFRPSYLSFSTTFVFAMYPQVPYHSGHGFVFVISPSTNFKHALPHAYLGLFNTSTNGRFSNHVFAVELDTIQDADLKDIDANHVGIDVNSLISDAAAPAAYYSDKEKVNKVLLLNSGKPMQVWIDYDEVEMLVNVTLAPFRHPKPSECLLSYQIDLSTILLDSMYVGFTSATGNIANSHYILGWSWNQSGKAQDFNPSELPLLPRIKHQKVSLNQTVFVVLLITVTLLLLLLMIATAVWFLPRKKYEELLEPWEEEYSPTRISYKDLFVATKGFKNSNLLGGGGFGKVYKGVLPSTRDEVAVKRVSNDSKQGMKEFIAEITSMKRLRHKNLVQLFGYCRRKGELLLVYEHMPNGSLDKYLFGKDDKSVLCWSSRFRIIKGVASALKYLHEGWEQVVLHRDVKASNVLLDAEMNARLGDFGLARLYDHTNDPRTTNVVGTIGYIAPEITKTRKPTTRSDVYAFGMFLLEVGCGRRPISKQTDVDAEDYFLSDWVYDCWSLGQILKASDPRMEGDYQEKEMELVLKLGLLCLHPKTDERPTMRQVVQFLNGSATLPEIPSDYDIKGVSSFMEARGKSGLLPSSSGTASLGFMSSSNSVLQHGR